jgi:hypothetical protein
MSHWCRVACVALLVCSAALVTIEAQTQPPAKAPGRIAQTKPQAPVAQTAPATPEMTNQDVIDLVKSGFGDDLVVNQVQTAKNKAFDVTTRGLIALKAAGVSDRIITVMTGSADPGRPTASTPQTPLPVIDAAPIVPEIGVYYKRDANWADLQPEVVNWKTGGVLKHIATAGIVKGDLNGIIQGPGSKTFLKRPLEILVYAPEGVAITEYQLLRLRVNKNAREFRTVTGGVLHSSGGAMRDLVPFESTKLAVRSYTLVLPNLTPGEYGILAPGSSSSSNAAAQLGKIYTFRLE